jgi:hypothetical protein
MLEELPGHDGQGERVPLGLGNQLVVLSANTKDTEGHFESDKDDGGQGQIGKEEAAFHVTGRRR